MVGLQAIHSVRFVKLTTPFLVYYKLYITFTLSGFLFDQSNVCRNFSILETLVIQRIPLPKKIYKHTRTRRVGILDEVEQYLPQDRSKLS